MRLSRRNVGLGLLLLPQVYGIAYGVLAAFFPLFVSRENLGREAILWWISVFVGCVFAVGLVWFPLRSGERWAWNLLWVLPPFWIYSTWLMVSELQAPSLENWLVFPGTYAALFCGLGLLLMRPDSGLGKPTPSPPPA